MASIRVFKNGEIQIPKFSLNQTYMFRLGTVALATVKNRVQKGINGNDARAKPLNRAYAITKSKLGKRNIRDLTFTGDMMRNLSVRSVSENSASMNVTTRDNRNKARANNGNEPWMVFSQKDKEDLVGSIEKILMQSLREKLNERATQAVSSRSLGPLG